MSQLSAKYTRASAGYQSDKDKLAECGILLGEERNVLDISIGQSHTYIYLEGYDKYAFNSVNFTFYRDGAEYNIFDDPEYNPYLTGLADH